MSLEQPLSATIEVAPGVYAAKGELRFHFARSGGPGGQNVNKVNTKAELRVNPAALRGLSDGARQRFLEANSKRITADGDLLVAHDTSRSQSANREACMEHLRAMLVAAMAEPKIRKRTRPTWSSRQRRLESKAARKRTKEGRQRHSIE